MNSKRFFACAKRLLLLTLAVALVMGMTTTAFATEGDDPYQTVTTTHNDVVFTYELFLTDQNMATVKNPRLMKAGETLYVEIRLTRAEYKGSSYDSYGIEFRLMTRGLTYNYDGVSLRSATEVREMVYSDGNSVGFAWYDFMQVGESINNPVMAASWSYTVEDPSKVNITVPVALIYLTGDNEGHVATGPATLYLDPNGGKIIGEDVSGDYTSGEAVVLPDAELGDAVFAGWSDGAHLYPAGSEYVVTGIVTLTAEWAELDRNRYLSLDPKGGELVGEDISGYYADGEIVVLPEVTREGYDFKGWNDGVSTYDAGAEYTVYNTVTIAAQWEPAAVIDPGTDPVEPIDPQQPADEESAGWFPWVIGLLGLFLLILLWLRRPVKYSLVNGNISLSYKNGETPSEVEVVLYDDEKEYHLNKSGPVEAKSRLKFIKNVTNVPIADIEPGTYKGKLLIHTGGEIQVKKCRIKALDRELDE